MSKIVGFTSGVFDMFNYEHIILIKRCKDLCDTLVVGVQTNPTLDNPVATVPIQTLTERLGQVWATRFADKTITYRTEEDLLQILKSLKPGKRFVSDKLKGKEFTGHDLGNAVFISLDVDYYSSQLRQRVIDAEKEKP